MALLSSYLRKQRLTKIRPYLKGRILDLGCGDASAVALISPQQSYTGVEVNVDVVERLRAQYPSHHFIAADLDQGYLGLLDRAYDTLVMCAIIEHLHNPESLLDQLSPTLADDGRLIVTTPTPLGDRIHHLGALVGLFSRLAVKEHVRIYGREELESLLSEHGFVVEHHEAFQFSFNHLFVARHGEIH